MGRALVAVTADVVELFLYRRRGGEKRRETSKINDNFFSPGEWKINTTSKSLPLHTHIKDPSTMLPYFTFLIP
jgi:hypothetical protein